MSDTISRQAAIDALKKISFSHWFEFGEYLSEDTREIEIINSNKALEAIEALPSAQPERIKGHWVEIASSNHTYKCSVCGRLLVNITDGKNNVAKNYPYCHCGANMRGEQDDE